MDLFFGSDRPTFPLIDKLQACETAQGLWISCVGIYQNLGNMSSKQHIYNQVKKLCPTYRCMSVNIEWCNGAWYDSDGPEIRMIPVSNLEEFVKMIMKRQRKTHQQKVDLMLKFGVVNEHVKVPIECSVLDVLIKACPFTVETQFRIGKYRLDAFISRLRIAIQIDEHNHSGYSIEEEKRYDTVIRDNNIVCIRFVPDTNKTDTQNGLDLVSMVWTRTLSPDFTTFARNHNL